MDKCAGVASHPNIIKVNNLRLAPPPFSLSLFWGQWLVGGGEGGAMAALQGPHVGGFLSSEGLQGLNRSQTALQRRGSRAAPALGLSVTCEVHAAGERAVAARILVSVSERTYSPA